MTACPQGTAGDSPAIGSGSAIVRPALADWKAICARYDSGAQITEAERAVLDGPLPAEMAEEARLESERDCALALAEGTKIRARKDYEKRKAAGPVDPEPPSPADAQSKEPVRLDRLAGAFKPIGELFGDPFNDEPPRRPQLLTAEVDGKESGILPLGIVGMIAAAGATGKSWLAILFALVVAVGREFIGLKVANPGRVLIALGEEDQGEVLRRLYHGGRLLGFNAEEQKLAASRIYALPLAGKATALTTDQDIDCASSGRPGDPADGLPVTGLYWELVDLLERNAGPDGWRLIVLDPLSRFAGAEVETSNAQATRFIQGIERLTAVPGNPTVLLCHHTGKQSRREGHSKANDSAAATAARGASALTDAVRWQANLEPQKRAEGAPEIVVFRVVKSNYGRYPPDTYLVRDPEMHGALRCATQADVAELSDALESAEEERKDDRHERELEDAMQAVMARLAAAASPLPLRALRGLVHKRGTVVDAALAKLAADRKVVRSSRGWSVSSVSQPSAEEEGGES